MMSRELKIKISKKEAPYASNEQLGTYTVRRWTFRQKQEAIMKSTTILDEKKGLGELNLIDFQIEQIMSCVTPPEGLIFDRKTTGALDPDVGDLLLDACRNVNGTTRSERANFLEQSEEKEPITG